MVDIINKNIRISKAPKAEDFRNMLKKMFSEAIEKGKDYVIIDAGELHSRVGNYPGKNSRMPNCCSVMRNEMKLLDKILYEPPSGKGSSLKIEYKLPR